MGKYDDLIGGCEMVISIRDILDEQESMPMYDISEIKDFDKTDSFQQLIVLRNAMELLDYLKKEYSDFPAGVSEEGNKALLAASNYIDDEVIHGGI